MQGWFNIRKSITVLHHINRLKKKNHMIISIRYRKALDTIQHPIVILGKTLSKIGMERNLLNKIKNIYKKSTPNIMLDDEKLDAFPLSLGKGKNVPFYYSYSALY